MRALEIITLIYLLAVGWILWHSEPPTASGPTFPAEFGPPEGWAEVERVKGGLVVNGCYLPDAETRKQPIGETHLYN